MATAAIIATFCNANAGQHATVQFRVNGALQGTYLMEFNEVQEAVTDEEKRAFARLMIKLHLLGKTPAQLRSDMISGFSSTI